MNILFSPPSLDDLIRLLKAWRLWVLAAFLGSLIGAAIYWIAPPPYRARATVLVDFNLEEAWPQDTDRQQFYYLEREARKLEEIAWSDEILGSFQSLYDIPVTELRGEILHLGQPAEGGWHFYADDPDPYRAVELAGDWAQAFHETVTDSVQNSAGLNSFIEVDLTQRADLPVERSIPLGAYLFAGALGAWFLGAFCILFFDIDRSRSVKTTAVKKQGKRRSKTSKR
jgi:hypothetical protein